MAGSMSRSERIDALVAGLAAEVNARAGTEDLADVAPATARRLVAIAARCWAEAAESGAAAPDHADLTPTEAVMLASACLQAHDLNPFDLALWFSRSTS